MAVWWQTPQEVQGALERVFSRPEFTERSASPLRELIGRALRSLVDLLRDLLPSFQLREGEGLALFVLVAVGFGALAGHLLLRVISHAGARKDGRGPQEARSQLAAPPASAAEWEALASSLAAAGRWRDAAFALYHGLLSRLAARGTVHLDPSKTPGDYRRESRRDPQAGRLLDRFLRGFEPVAFGARPADESDFGKLRDLASSAPEHAVDHG